MQLKIGDGYFDSKIRILHLIGCGQFKDYKNDYNKATYAVIKSADPNYSLSPGERIEDNAAYISLEADWDDYEAMIDVSKRNSRKLASFIDEKTRPHVIICWGWKRSTNTTSAVRCLCEEIFGEPVRELYHVRSVEGDTYGNVYGYGVLNWWGPWQNSFNPETVAQDLYGYFSKKERRHSSGFSRSVNRGSSIKSVLLFLVVQFCLWYLPIILKVPDLVVFTIIGYYALAIVLPYVKNKSPNIFFRTLKGKVGKIISAIGGAYFIINSIMMLSDPNQITGVNVSVTILIPLVFSLFSIFNCRQQSSILHSTAFFDGVIIYIQFFINLLRPTKDGDTDLGFLQQLRSRFYSVEHHKKIDSTFIWERIPPANEQKGEGSSENDSEKPEENDSYDPSESKRSYYLQILEVDETASDEDITKLYHELIRKYHPDLFVSETIEIQKEMEEKTKLVNEAYEFLVENKNK